MQLELGEDEPTLFWDADGVLFFEEDLTDPAGLVIVSYAEGEDD